MKHAAARSSNTPVVAPYSHMLVLMTGREHVAALLEYVSGWVQRGVRVRIEGLPCMPSDEEAGPRAPQALFRRVVFAASVDAASEALARRGVEVETEILEPVTEAAETEVFARAVREWQPELVVGAPANPVALAGLTDRPVLVLPQPFAHGCQVPPQRIFVASDGSAASALAVREAARVAASGAAVRVGYLACDPAAAQHPEDFDAIVLAAQHDGDATSHAIVEAALQWRADLLVVGTRGGHEGGRWRYGSIAADVAQRTVLPLLLVPLPAKGTSFAHSLN
jgi:nucleotide-binding universal stress UspA family protein